MQKNAFFENVAHTIWHPKMKRFRDEKFVIKKAICVNVQSFVAHISQMLNNKTQKEWFRIIWNKNLVDDFLLLMVKYGKYV
jgi:hypothetical protein